MAHSPKTDATLARMTNASTRPMRKRGPATRDIILDESLKLFAHKGFEATSVRDISRAVGVSDAALYRHFAAKDVIARELFQHHYGQLAMQIRKINEGKSPFAVKIGELVDLLCKLYDEAPAVFTFILLSQHEYLRFVGDNQNAVAEIVRLMETAKYSGDITIEEPELAAAMALGMALQPAIFKLYNRLPGPLSGRRKYMESAILAALGCRMVC